MTLQDYREQQGLRRAAVAKTFGVDWITVWRWETGRSRPLFDVMLSIQTWSGGKVTPNDWIKAAA